LLVASAVSVLEVLYCHHIPTALFRATNSNFAKQEETNYFLSKLTSRPRLFETKRTLNVNTVIVITHMYVYEKQKMLATPAVRMKSPINLLNGPEPAYLR
jgi:hypothetical protein